MAGGGWIRALGFTGLLLALACGGGPPSPPRLSARPVDPAVRTLIEDALERVDDDRSDLEARYVLAAAYHANGVFGEAAAAWMQLTAMQPERAQAWYHLAEVQYELGDGTSFVSLARAIELEPDYAPAQRRLGLWCLEDWRLGQAREAFTRASELDPDRGGGQAGLARVALAEEDYALAIRILEERLVAAPGDGYARHLLGRALALTGAGERAERELMRAASTRPVWPDPWRTALHCAAGNFAEALDVLERAAAHLPGHHRVELLKGLVHEQSGDVREAIVCTRRAIELHPEFGPAYLRLGGLLSSIGDAVGARGALQESVKLGLDTPRQLLDLGILQRMTGRGEDAVMTFERAAQADPDSFLAHLFLARAQGEIGNLLKARVAYRRAQELMPDHPHLPGVDQRLRELEAQESR